jgi:hypothetical protein
VVGPLGEDPFVDDWWKLFAAAVTPATIVGVNEPGGVAAGLILALEAPAGQELVLEGRVEALRRGVVERDPTRPVDWVTPSV